MTELPPIVIDGNASFFVCPVCRGRGFVRETVIDHRPDGITTNREYSDGCSHCFGFGRLPVPSWYREQEGER